MNRNNFGNFNNFNNSNFNQRPVSPLDGIKRFFTGKSMLSILIIINIAVFLAIGLFNTYCFLFRINPYQFGDEGPTIIGYWLAIPSNLSLLVNRPWTFLTNMFLQEQFWHLFPNMLMLYLGGMIFKEYLGSRKLFVVYILGGLAGALCFIASFNYFPGLVDKASISIAMGASASVLAIIVAIATYIPNYNIRLFFIGQVKFKWIAISYVIIDLISMPVNSGGHLAHLGGAFFGFVYILALKRGLILTQFWAPFKKLFKPKPKMKATYSKKPMTDDEFNYQRKVNQQRIDEILDKIKKSGYESLSKEDKELLFKASKNS